MNPVTEQLPAAWRLPEWQISLQATGRSPGTVDRYAYHVRCFARAHPDPMRVTVGDVEERLSRCRSPEYGRAVRVALHAWYLWAQREGLANADPTAPIAPIRIPRARARPCPESVYKQARIGADPDTRLMVELAAQAGLRRSEIAAVRAPTWTGRGSSSSARAACGGRSPSTTGCAQRSRRGAPATRSRPSARAPGT
jgi:integrase